MRLRQRRTCPCCGQAAYGKVRPMAGRGDWRKFRKGNFCFSCRACGETICISKKEHRLKTCFDLLEGLLLAVSMVRWVPQCENRLLMILTAVILVCAGMVLYSNLLGCFYDLEIPPPPPKSNMWWDDWD